jgi:hypothetical protein
MINSAKQIKYIVYYKYEQTLYNVITDKLIFRPIYVNL